MVSQPNGKNVFIPGPMQDPLQQKIAQQKQREAMIIQEALNMYASVHREYYVKGCYLVEPRSPQKDCKVAFEAATEAAKHYILNWYDKESGTKILTKIHAILHLEPEQA